MAASTRLSPFEVARILNRFGPTAYGEDVSELLADYFTDSPALESDDSDADEDSYVTMATVTQSLAADQEQKDLLNQDFICLQEPSQVLPDFQRTVDVCDKLEDFLRNGCGCERHCVTKFPVDLVKQSHLDCLECDMYCDEHVNHQHLLLFGCMNSLVHNQPETIQKGHKSHARIESRSTYMFRGVEVCRKFFAVVFGCGEKRLKNVKKRFLLDGVSPKQHGNVHQKSHSANFDKRLAARNFIQNFAENNALVMPGRLPNYKNPNLKLLPSSMTKKYVFSLYVSAAKQSDEAPLSWCLFRQVWADFCQNVVIQLPRSDLCAICQQNQMTVAKMRNLPEDTKLQLIKNCQDHLVLVQNERKHYSTVIEMCKKQPNCPIELGEHLVCSFTGNMHISFDFAQQIHLPFDSQQVGPIYFLTGYKVALFGIAVEPVGKFVLYVIPEACATGKGANIVLSLLHHFFEHFGIGETDVFCHADNCCGQNKNNIVMQYASWNTFFSFHHTFTINFLPVGHTKFWPDLYFGLFKKKLRTDKAETVEDVCRIARDACPITHAIIPVPVGNESGSVKIPTYDWSSKFQPTMKIIPDLKQFHHFHFSSDSKGRAFCKKAATDPDADGVTVELLKNVDQLTISLPDLINPAPFPLERRKYLAYKIRPFVSSEVAKDILCPIPSDTQEEPEPVVAGSAITSPGSFCAPEPVVAKPAGTVATEGGHSTNELPCAKRKSPVCGYCKQEGHRNQVRNGVPLCPKRKADFVSE